VVTRPWAPGTVTGIGSLPGTDPVEAAKLVVGELPDLPHLAELPARGAGAEMIGRSAALLVDIPVEIGPSAWRLATHDGRDVRRARDFLAWDVDALEAAAAGRTGPVKVQVTGPWTLAASVELPNGHRILADHGAVRDCADSLAEGLRQHLAEIARRLPGVDLVVQVDEPSLPAVLGGRIPTPSGYGTIRAVEGAVVAQTLGAVLAAAPAGGRVVHCCASDVPVGLLRSAGIDAISLDASLLGKAGLDPIGEAIDAGVAVWLGVVPATDSPIRFETARETVKRIWSTLGFAPAAAAGAIVPTPACGLAGATPAYARRALAVLRDVGKALLDDAA
jgi:methionine synthase II (cobalamin-independent)